MRSKTLIKFVSSLMVFFLIFQSLTPYVSAQTDNEPLDSEYQEKLEVAQNAIIKAFESKVQEDLDFARSLVNELNEPELGSLNEALDILQEEINYEFNYPNLLQKAIRLIEIAESNKTQENVDTALESILDLKGDDQEEFYKRIKILQEIIDKEYNSLLEEILNDLVAIEATKDLSDIDSLRSKLSILKERDQKDFEERLNNIIRNISETVSYREKLSRITEAVNNIKDLTSIQYVQSLIEDLKEEDRMEYQIILDEIVRALTNDKNYNDQLTKIETLIEEAESSKSENDIEKAYSEIENMKTFNQPTEKLDADKASLTAKLNLLKTNLSINGLEELLIKIESNKSKKDYELAKHLLSILIPNESVNRLIGQVELLHDSVLYGDNNSTSINQAKSRLEYAEKYQSEFNIRTARQYISKLKTSHIKNIYTIRVNAINNPSITDAYKAVNTVENSQLESDFESAKILINQLEDSDSKAVLNEVLNSIIIVDPHFKESINKVRLAEQSKYKPEIAEAKNAVLKINDEQIKNSLLKRVNGIVPTSERIGMNSSSKIEQAKLLLKLSEDNPENENDYSRASNRIQELLGSIEKDYLFTRLLAIKDSNTKHSLELLDKANQSLTVEDLDEARRSINSVNNKVAIRALNQYLQDTQLKYSDVEYNKALSKVEIAEKSGYQPDIEEASNSIQILPDNQSKRILINRVKMIVENDEFYGNNSKSAIINAQLWVDYAKKYGSLDYSRGKINELLLGSPIKDYFLIEIKGITDQEIARVISLINDAKESLSQKELFFITEDIKQIDDILDKRGLNAKFELVNSEIEKYSESLVELAEKTGLQKNIDKARDQIISSLIQGNFKESLIKRLTEIKTETEDFIIDDGITPENENAIEDMEKSNRDYARFNYLSYEDLISIKKRAYVTSLGGLFAQVPQASSFLRHFLFNTGRSRTIDFSKMITDSPNAYTNTVSDLNKFLLASEELGIDGQVINIRSKREEVHSLGGLGEYLKEHHRYKELNWFASINGYRTSISAKVEKNGNRYKAVIKYRLRDFYDWNIQDTDKAMGMVNNSEMAELHRHGMAKDFAVSGQTAFEVEWNEGERVTKITNKKILIGDILGD